MLSMKPLTQLRDSLGLTSMSRGKKLTKNELFKQSSRFAKAVQVESSVDITVLSDAFLMFYEGEDDLTGHKVSWDNGQTQIATYNNDARVEEIFSVFGGMGTGMIMAMEDSSIEYTADNLRGLRFKIARPEKYKWEVECLGVDKDIDVKLPEDEMGTPKSKPKLVKPEKSKGDSEEFTVKAGTPTAKVYNIIKSKAEDWVSYDQIVAVTFLQCGIGSKQEVETLFDMFKEAGVIDVRKDDNGVKEIKLLKEIEIE